MLKPQATATRDLINLDGTWRFAIDFPDLNAPWSSVLPGALEAAVPASFNDQFIDSAIRGHVGLVWYQRTVRVPRGWRGERIVLRVDAATHAGFVYVDDALVAEHVGGYTPFEADLTDVVEAGQAVRLTIGVDNRLTNVTIPPGTVTTGPDGKEKQAYLHDFYNYAGLARSVWLYSTPTLHLDDITVTTTVDGSTGLVHYTVDSTGGDGTGAAVRVRLADAAGVTVAESSGASGTLQVTDVQLWQPGAAYLYDLTAEIVDGDEVVDGFTLAVGVRTVEVRGEQFLINGEPFYFTGFGKHEDTAIRGKGHDDAYLVHDFQLLDWIGANSFRTSHYPYAEEVLDFADRHGIVVIDETAAVGLNLGVTGGLSGAPVTPTFAPDGCNDQTQAAHAQHIRELIARDKNHPSVVMWCVANEPASNEDGAREYFEPLIALTRELDPTRPVTIAEVMFATFENDKVADLLDVICLNRYYGWYVAIGDLETAEKYLEHDLRGWADKYGKPIMMAEYGVDTLSGLHSLWNVPWTEEYQRDYLAMHHRVFDRTPSFVGEQIWNFADFQTTVGIHRIDGNKKGVFTRDRKPKSAAHGLRDRWRGLQNRKPGTEHSA
ncbi:beta-glucuronidase (plasmid) [Rathayibacter sp. VKM Ac-2803]|uniref:Beta-glucuronidase n=1 Tax=Rathayibacter caricis DSM 15933 TaxID=1328867 RepID=A0A2T4UNQ8_9MICO|nr:MULTISPECIES: beta-glucuronidase [Rathayibacter]MWV51558.1 beta-glucuronidase [Rathayibacter sp. VKM Ac-2803]PTL71160.1 beta-glucuronidase [Rathayibacter caricis DSM 15933]